MTRGPTRLFVAGELRGLPEHPSLAVHAPALTPVAWADRLNDLRAFRGVLGEKKDVLILQGSVSTLLVATAPVGGAAGGPRGLATATLPIAVRRNIRNEFLADFDLIAGSRPEWRSGTWTRGTSPRDRRRSRPFQPAHARSRPRCARRTAACWPRSAWSGPRRRTGRSASPRATGSASRSGLRGRPGLGPGPVRTARGRRLRLVAAATMARVLLVLGPPLPDPRATVLSPDAFASTLMGPLLTSPLDLFLTASWLVVLAAVLFELVMSAPPARPSMVRALCVSLLALPVLGAVFYWIADTVANTPLDIEAIPLLPKSPAQLLIHLSLLLVLAAGLLLLMVLFAQDGPVVSRRAAAQRAASGTRTCPGRPGLRVHDRLARTSRLGVPTRC